MNTLRHFLLPMMGILALSACSERALVSEDSNIQDGTAGRITVCSEMVRFDGPESTRAEYTVSDRDGFVLNWTLGDTIGIYPVGGDQHAFPISEGSGSSAAVFDGGTWAVKEGYEYSAYYPYEFMNGRRKVTALPVSYDGQTQTANGVASHLAAYDYQASAPTQADGTGEILISLKHLGCFLRIQMLIPNPDSFTRLVLESSGTKFATAGTFDLTQETPAIAPTRTAQSVTLTLDGVSTTQENQVLTMYMCLPPCDLTGSTIHATLYGNMVQTYVQDFEGKDFEAGKAYAYSAENTEVTEFEGHEYVDLGLPSGNLWATCNMGATQPEQSGSCYAWGETSTKSSYSWSTYSGYTASWIEKAPLDGDGFPIGEDIQHPAQYPDYGLDICGSTHDAATANWGGYWHMPTDVDIQELLDNCTWTSTTKNGVSGYKVTGTSGNWIFIPNSSLWTSTLYSRGSEDYAKYLYGNSLSSTSRYYGYYVRPVYNPDVTKITVEEVPAIQKIGNSIQLNVSVYPANAADKTLSYSSSDNTVAVVSNTGLIIAVSNGNSNITVSHGAISVDCPVHVHDLSQALSPEYVDLGLSVNWATFNVGACCPECYGDYFAWGATEPLYYAGYAQSTSPVWKSGKSGGYNWVNTPYQTANTTDYSSTRWTKYLGSTTSPYKDPSATNVDALKTVLDPEDDAAHVNWGGSWRMPTRAEQDELRTNCTWTWTTINGIKGYKVQSNKSGYTDRWIFLPAAGFRYDTYLNLVGSYGYYWSSSLITDYPDDAYGLGFSSGLYSTYSDDRYFAQSVRPVCQ